MTGTIAALRHDLSGDALATFIKSTVQTEPQLDGKLTTNGEISPANVVNAIFTPTVTAAASASLDHGHLDLDVAECPGLGPRRMEPA